MLVQFAVLKDLVLNTIPSVTNLGPAGVWEYTKETFRFLKLVYGAFKKSEGKIVVTRSGALAANWILVIPPFCTDRLNPSRCFGGGITSPPARAGHIASGVPCTLAV
jgi:hypothetical protein